MSKTDNNDTLLKIGLVVILALSAMTTFGFFIESMPGLIPLPFGIDPAIIKLITGAIGVLLFDGGAFYWLSVHNKSTENSKQRNVSNRIFWVCVAGSIMASLVYLVLFASNLWTVPQDARDVIGFAALIGVAFVVSFHFYSGIEMTKHNEENRVRVAEANSADKAERAERDALVHLDTLMEKEVKDQLTKIAPVLANRQAADIVRQRLLRMSSRFDVSDILDDDSVIVPGTFADDDPQPPRKSRLDTIRDMLPGREGEVQPAMEANKPSIGFDNPVNLVEAARRTQAGNSTPPTLYAVFKNGRQAGVGTTKADAEAAAKQMRQYQSETPPDPERRSPLPTISVRPIKAAAAQK